MQKRLNKQDRKLSNENRSKRINKRNVNLPHFYG